ncbi:MAG: epoxyqueuosine reductase QueH [Bacillota bacterium]
MKPGLLVHACCGPCLLGAARGLPAGNRLVYFANPNIEPEAEAARRWESLCSAAGAQGWEAVSAPIGRQEWLEATQGLEAKERCQACYRVRLELTAAEAASRGIPAFTTTLLASPYQDRPVVLAAGEVAAGRHGVEFLRLDLRPWFREGQAAAAKLGLYRQRYCGCLAHKLDAGGSGA